MPRAPFFVPLPDPLLVTMKRPAPPAAQLTDSEETTREYLLTLPLFDTFSGEELTTLARHLNFAEIGRGERLCSEGEPADFMCFVASGRLDVLKKTAVGDYRVVARAGRGRTVGEMALFDRSPRSATVIARQPSVVILLTRKGFDLLTARHPGLGLTLMRNILRLLSLNMRLTTSRLADQLPG